MTPPAIARPAAAPGAPELGSLLAGALQVDGDSAAWTEMWVGLDSPDPSFDIVLP